MDVVQTISADCPDVPVEDAECGDRAEDGDGDARHAASPPPPQDAGRSQIVFWSLDRSSYSRGKPVRQNPGRA